MRDKTYNHILGIIKELKSCGAHGIDVQVGSVHIKADFVPNAGLDAALSSSTPVTLSDDVADALDGEYQNMVRQEQERQRRNKLLYHSS